MPAQEPMAAPYASYTEASMILLSFSFPVPDPSSKPIPLPNSLSSVTGSADSRLPLSL